jgi:hypothetical protein
MTTKKHAATLFILMMAALTGLANAQSIMLKAQVPFDFVVNGKTIPAGQCLIQSLDNVRTVLSISNGNQHDWVLPIGDQSPKAGQETVLVFHRYGDRYFLAAIKRAGKSGYQLPPTKLEVELRAQNVTEEVFTLVASVQ